MHRMLVRSGVVATLCAGLGFVVGGPALWQHRKAIAEGEAVSQLDEMAEGAQAYYGEEHVERGAAPVGNTAITPSGGQDIDWARSVASRGDPVDRRWITAEGLLSQHDLALGGEVRCSELLCARGELIEATLPAAPDIDALALVGFSSAEALGPKGPREIVFVLDASGSMTGEPMRVAKRAIEVLVNDLEPNDQISLIVFSNWFDLALDRVSVRDAEALPDVLAEVTARGSTNIEVGLARGLRLLRDTDPWTGRVVMLSDQQPNVGATTVGSFSHQVSQATEAGIGLTMIGVGRPYGHELTERMNDWRGVNSFYLAGDDDLPALDHALELVATGLSVELRPPSGYRVTEVWGAPGARGGPKRAAERFRVPSVFVSSGGGGLVIGLARDPHGASEGAGNVELGYVDLRGEAHESVGAVSWVDDVAPGLARARSLVDMHTTLQRAGEEGDTCDDLAALTQRLERTGDPALQREVDFVRDVMATRSAGCERPKREIRERPPVPPAVHEPDSAARGLTTDRLHLILAGFGFFFGFFGSLLPPALRRRNP